MRFLEGFLIMIILLIKKNKGKPGGSRLEWFLVYKERCFNNSAEFSPQNDGYLDENA